MKLFRYLTLAMLLMCVVTANAQKNFLKDADKAYNNKAYFDAIDLYKKAYSKTNKAPEKTYCLFKTAECYRMIGDFKQMETWYTKAIKGKYPDPSAVLYLADAKKALEKYDEAKIEYDNYKKLKPDDKRGEDGSKSCQLAAKWKQNPTRHVVTNMALINSKEADFSPAFQDGIGKKVNALTFTSTRPGATGGIKDNGLGQLFSDLFETKLDKNGKWSTPAPMPNTINTESNDGSASYDRKGKVMYYTRCGNEKKKEIHCQVYVANKKGANNWDEPKPLPFNVDSFTFGHPAFYESDKGDFMIFASDQPGGQGGRDLWISNYDKKKKEWSPATNMGPGINTSGDEMYPFVREDGTLFFSSNGHVGMGGLDIFKAEKKGDTYTNVQNLKFPLNSAADDFGIIFEENNERGYLSSNREGTKGLDDIWSFALPPCVYPLDGVITDCKFGFPLEGVAVTLIGSDGTTVEAKTDKKGYYKFVLTENVTYEIKLNTAGVTSDRAKDGYILHPEKSKGKVTTVGENDCSKSFKKDLCMTPIEPKGIRLPLIQYEYDKADLTPAAKDSLNFLFQTLTDNPTFVIELNSHTDFRGNDKYNMNLSQRRAESVVKYMIEKGINPARMVAKGKGESEPSEVLDANGKVMYMLNEAYITKLKTKEDQEAAHQINRRTSFKVLRKDFVDPNAPKEQPKVQPKKDDKQVDPFEDEEEKEEAPKQPEAPKTTPTPEKKPN